MHPDDPRATWLAAEDDDDPVRADQALREVFASVPRRQPRPAVTDRLLAIALRRPKPQARRQERLIAAAIVGGALAMTLAPLAALGALLMVDAGRVVSAVARVFVWTAEWLSTGVSLWSIVARTGTVLAHAVNTPAGGAATTVTLLAASMALLMLNRYLPMERR